MSTATQISTRNITVEANAPADIGLWCKTCLRWIETGGQRVDPQALVLIAVKHNERYHS